ncbi:hypothetical protein BT93_B0174 [Corymbia citriodora subsp. variegata]|nr:hypothetical protein BT93_B0174 [Corymbia citriodora subsp. variegata]
MKTNQTVESVKLDRKTSERNRRIHMKGLCFKLASLIPPHHFKSSQGMFSEQNAVIHATAYINQLKERVEELKMRKELAMRSNGLSKSGSRHPPSLSLPIVKLGFWDSGLEVMLISGVDKNFTLSEAISILKEEGAEAVCGNISAISDKVFHTIFAQVRLLRVGVDTSRICERLHQLVFSS